MQTVIKLFFLTLVLSIIPSKADPHNFAPRNIEDPSSDTKDIKHIENENLIIIPPSDFSNLSSEKKKYYYPYLHSISPRLGFLLDASTLSQGEAIPVIIGFNYLSPNFRSPQWEIGADLLTTSKGQLSVAKRWIINPRATFRPFYKLGVTHKVIPNEALASFTNYENYYFEAVLGIEDLLAPPMSIRMDFLFQIGANDMWVGFVFGYSWAW